MLNVRKLVLYIISLCLLLSSTFLVFLMTNSARAAGAVQAYSVSTRDFYVPSGSDPWGTAFDSSGHVWLALPGCDPSPTCSSNTGPGKIEEYNPSNSGWMATYQLPSGYAQPLFLALDSQGRVWFPMPMDNSIGMLNPSNKTFQQWSVPTGNAGPWGVAIDHNGNIWFTEHFTNKIGRFDPTTQKFVEVSTSASNSQPYGIVVDSSNNVWFTENNSSVALIGEYTSGGKLQEYKIRTGSTSGLTPHLISVDPNGNIWWSEGWVGMIAELKVGQAAPGTNKGVTEYSYKRPCSSCGTHTSGISVDSNGLVWFDDAEQEIFGSFPDNGSGSFVTYNSPTSNGHPHDGLHVDGQNRVWFDEEFANKLAEATQSGAPTPTPTPTQKVQPSPTSTGISSPTPTTTSSPTATPSPGSTLAQDTFKRGNQTHWGNASDGQAWGGDANSASVFSISGNVGQVSNGNTSYNAILGPSSTNAQVLFSGSISNFNNVNLGSVLRWSDGNNWYKAFIDGSDFIIQKKVNGNTSILSQVSFSAKAGTSYTLRFRVSGTTLSAKVWQTNQTEPANWMVSATDSSFQSGYCGLRMLDQNGAVVTYTSFTCISQ
jgi:virginiamycin B lyase